METTAKMKRLGSWKRKMRALPPKVRAELSRAAETNSKAFRDAAQRQAPEITGELRISVIAYPAQGYQGTVWRVRAGEKKGDAFYARFVEFGTQKREAEPFFFPTYRAMRTSFRARSSRAIRKAQKQAIK